MLIMFSGLPGCGKTTLARMIARRLHIPLLAKDRVERFLRDTVPGAEPLHSYLLLFDLADEQLALGVSVTLDAVFPMAEFRGRIRELATRHNTELRVIYCYCSDEVVWRARVGGRVQYVPGWTPAGWAEVERVSGYFEPWDRESALFVDAMRPVEENFARVLEYLGLEPQGAE